MLTAAKCLHLTAKCLPVFPLVGLRDRDEAELVRTDCVDDREGLSPHAKPVIKLGVGVREERSCG